MLLPCQRLFLSLLLLTLTVHFDSTHRAHAQDQPATKDSARLHRLDPQTAEGLRQLLRRTDDPLPLVSGHRGGAGKGFPENCIPTFEHTLERTYALLEIDPRYTKDGEVVVFHDATLERCSNGRGRVADHTLAELKKLRLKDLGGNLTDFQIPTLDEVLAWAQGKTVVVLDQKDVPTAVRAKKITEAKAEAYAMLIVNSFKDAKECHELNPNIAMEVMIPNRDKFHQFDQLGIPWQNVVAFVGHVPPTDEGLYKLIHARGACCMIGTSRNLDKKFLTAEVTDLVALEPDYRAYLQRGADLIETDIPAQLGPMLYRATKVPAGKENLFQPAKP